jgi:cell division protein FtsX
MLRIGGMMFQNMGFLIAEMWMLLVLAGLLGVAAGWLIWGRKPKA